MASVPSAHPYVQSLAPLSGPSPVRLPDPDPERPDRPAHDRWWPAAMLEPSWVMAHEFDVMHLHFGFDHRTPAELREWVSVLRKTGRPLVLTVHDLRNPHHEEPAMLDAQLDVLVPAAESLVTLTDSAADEVERRWHRRAVVLPHPHVVDLAVIARVRNRRDHPATHEDHGRVGVALKSLRRNTDGARLLPALRDLTRRGHRVIVTLHREVARSGEPEARRQVAALEGACRRGELELILHERLDDQALWAQVAQLDVVVLPYRFGTHSGWLEMCHDLATSVVAPDVGHYAGQGADASYRATASHVDAASLVAAVESALEGRRSRLPGLGAHQRSVQREQVAAAHDRIYRDAVASRSGAA